MVAFAPSLPHMLILLKKCTFSTSAGHLHRSTPACRSGPWPWRPHPRMLILLKERTLSTCATHLHHKTPACRSGLPPPRPLPRMLILLKKRTFSTSAAATQRFLISTLYALGSQPIPKWGFFRTFSAQRAAWPQVQPKIFLSADLFAPPPAPALTKNFLHPNLSWLIIG
jgi:hypothetical protein